MSPLRPPPRQREEATSSGPCKLCVNCGLLVGRKSGETWPGRFSTKDSSRAPSPKPGVFFGNDPLGSILPGFSAHRFPRSLGELRSVVSPISGQQEFPRIPDSFTEGLSLVFASRQTFRNPHKWPVFLPETLSPLPRLHKYMGAGERERKPAVRAVPSPPPPSRSGPRRQGPCLKPTCPVSAVVMATREGGIVIGPLYATPLHRRFPVTEATKRHRPPPFIPPRESCVGEGPAFSLASKIPFLQNGVYSHTIINGEREYEAISKLFWTCMGCH